MISTHASQVAAAHRKVIKFSRCLHSKPRRSLLLLVQHCKRLRTLDISRCNNISVAAVDFLQTQLPFLENLHYKFIGGADRSLSLWQAEWTSREAAGTWKRRKPADRSLLSAELLAHVNILCKRGKNTLKLTAGPNYVISRVNICPSVWSRNHQFGPKVIFKDFKAPQEEESSQYFMYLLFGKLDLYI